eukprot:163170_1
MKTNKNVFILFMLSMWAKCNSSYLSWVENPFPAYPVADMAHQGVGWNPKDGKVYLFGGWSNSGNNWRTVVTFDPINATWAMDAPLLPANYFVMGTTYARIEDVLYMYQPQRNTELLEYNMSNHTYNRITGIS